ncbi:MAG TPA: hypothetical protein PLH67_14440 [Lentisphaeria bacterium]|nr:hypothetical protein [Lentisphaeria bacterium]
MQIIKFHSIDASGFQVIDDFRDVFPGQAGGCRDAERFLLKAVAADGSTLFDAGLAGWIVAEGKGGILAAKAQSDGKEVLSFEQPDLSIAEAVYGDGIFGSQEAFEADEVAMRPWVVLPGFFLGDAFGRCVDSGSVA